MLFQGRHHYESTLLGHIPRRVVERGWHGLELNRSRHGWQKGESVPRPEIHSSTTEAQNFNQIRSLTRLILTCLLTFAPIRIY